MCSPGIASSAEVCPVLPSIRPGSERFEAEGDDSMKRRM